MLIPIADLTGRLTLCSGGTSRLLVPNVKLSTAINRDFPVASLHTWNTLPQEMTLLQLIFCQHLTTLHLCKSNLDPLIVRFSHEMQSLLLTSFQIH